MALQEQSLALTGGYTGFLYGYKAVVCWALCTIQTTASSWLFQYHAEECRWLGVFFSCNRCADPSIEGYCSPSVHLQRNPVRFMKSCKAYGLL